MKTKIKRSTTAASLLLATAFLSLAGFVHAASKPVQAPLAVPIGKIAIEAQAPKVQQASLGTPHVITDTGNYAFSTATNASLTDMSSGTTQLVAANQDDTASAVTNIGFDFFFQGARFSQFSANSNGLMRLGGTAVQGASPYKPLAQAGISLITPYGSDQRTHTTGKVHFKVTGSAPSRVLIVEWLNMQANFNSGGTVDLTYQARLYEATGVIEFVYGSMTMSTAGAARTRLQRPKHRVLFEQHRGNCRFRDCAAKRDTGPKLRWRVSDAGGESLYRGSHYYAYLRDRRLAKNLYFHPAHSNRADHS